jgi:hypothetical protein
MVAGLRVWVGVTGAREEGGEGGLEGWCDDPPSRGSRSHRGFESGTGLRVQKHEVRNSDERMRDCFRFHSIDTEPLFFFLNKKGLANSQYNEEQQYYISILGSRFQNWYTP